MLRVKHLITKQIESALKKVIPEDMTAGESKKVAYFIKKLQEEHAIAKQVYINQQAKLEKQDPQALEEWKVLEETVVDHPLLPYSLLEKLEKSETLVLKPEEYMALEQVFEPKPA